MLRCILLMIVFIVLTSSECRQEGPDCHYVIIIKNASSEDVLWGRIGEGTKGCRLSGHELKSGAQAEYRPSNWCMENSGMISGGTIDIYFIDPGFFNAEGVYYPCDSIPLKNTILRHDVYTLKDLQEKNFAIQYQ